MNYSNFLTIDIGNTNTTCSLCNKVDTFFFSIEELIKFKTKFNINKSNTKTLVSSVNQGNFSELNDLSPTLIKDFFKDNSFFSMPVNYNETVGLDRLICAFYAFHHKMNATVIDSGSFTTIDSVTSTGFNGGYILPGLKLLQETYKQGSQLRTFKPGLINCDSIPQKSEDAINAGLTESFIAPIKNIISKYKNETILLTGGNSDLLVESTKIAPEPNLIHKSMQLILKEYL